MKGLKNKTLVLFILRFFTLFVTVLIFTSVLKGQSYSQFIFDKKQSEYFGANNLSSFHHGLYLFEDKYLPDTLLKRNRCWKKSINIGYRLVKFYFVDAQMDGFIALLQHEVFGHGARFREFGYQKNSYNLNLYPPFGSGGGFAQRGSLANGSKPPTYQENIAVNFSGVESEMLLAKNLTTEILLNDSLHYRQGLLYLISQNNQLLYLWYSRLSSKERNKAGNDMMNYIAGVNYYYGKPGTKGYDINLLSNQSLISFGNPIQLYSAFAIVYDYLIKGRKGMNKIPMIPLGKVGYLPAFNYSLTPFGSQYHFTNYLRYKRMLFNCDVGLGNNTFNDFYHISASAYNLINNRWITMNCSADFWNQPKLELESYGLHTSSNSPGGSCKVGLIVRPFKLLYKAGLYVEAGYKSKGYLPGEDLAETFILRYGFSLHL